MVGEEVVEQCSDISILHKGAGKNAALKSNGYFEPRPHPRPPALLPQDQLKRLEAIRAAGN